MAGLDFIVIGAQKGGTTSLWQYLRSHPEIVMPPYKEAPILCAAEEDRLPELLRTLVETDLADGPPEAKRGKAAAHYMMGRGDIDVPAIAERIGRLLPGAALIALLRDPVDRAISQYRMSVRRGYERRDLNEAVEEELAADRLHEARRRPTEVNSYLVQGEYGRILGIYRERVPAESLLVEMSADLERDPGAVLDRVLSHIGLPPGHRPERLGTRHNRGGMSRRLDEEMEARLREHMSEQIWPYVREPREPLERAFEFFLETWNTVPEESTPELSRHNRERLEAHFAADARRLSELGIAAPWLDEWRSRE